MTYYLLYSETYERWWNMGLPTGPRKNADGTTTYPPKTFPCLYADSTGEPVRVSEVANSIPTDRTYGADLVCVDKTEKGVCLATRNGLQQAGVDFCKAKGIPATPDSILNYMKQVDDAAEEIRRPFKVKGPIKFKP